MIQTMHCVTASCWCSKALSWTVQQICWINSLCGFWLIDANQALGVIVEVADRRFAERAHLNNGTQKARYCTREQWTSRIEGEKCDTMLDSLELLGVCSCTSSIVKSRWNAGEAAASRHRCVENVQFPAIRVTSVCTGFNHSVIMFSS